MEENQKPNKLGPVIMGVIILLLVVVIGTQFYLIMQMSNTGTGKVVEDSKDKGKKALIAIEDVEPVSVVEKKVYTLAPDSIGQQYRLRVTIHLGVNSKSSEYKEKAILIEEKKPIVGDIIDTVIRGKNYENYQQPNFWTDLKKELLEKINEKFDTDIMVDVFFEDVYIELIS
ncbi:MAG TPA: hypothetical protein DEP72_09145 [Clostridiales bacterium]|nr:MAG: hypothetical protein A2Y18_05865 [Clostridiales bacterium GWD2_32_19]HCC08305.1 hypothetical protein [Clostridiales bacterium]